MPLLASETALPSSALDSSIARGKRLSYRDVLMCSVATVIRGAQIMPRRQLTESIEKTKQRIMRHEPRLAPTRSYQGGSNPILQLQQTLGNQRVAQLIKAKRL